MKAIFKNIIFILHVDLLSHLYIPDCQTKKMSDIKKKTRGIRKENPDPDKKCVFPFMHGGKKYCKCTTVGTFGKLDGLDKFWCATKLDNKTYNLMNKESWGLCTDSCLITGTHSTMRENVNQNRVCKV